MDFFLPLIQSNAETSLSEEAGCHKFDICVDPSRSNEVFLYELYDDAAAFDAHMQSSHYSDFQAAVRPMIAKKNIRTFAKVIQ